MAKDKLLRLKHILVSDEKDKEFVGVLVCASYCFATKTQYHKWLHGSHVLEVVASRSGYPSGCTMDSKVFYVSIDGRHFVGHVDLRKKLYECFYMPKCEE